MPACASGWRLLVRGQMTGRSVLTEVVTERIGSLPRPKSACSGTAAAPTKNKEAAARALPRARQLRLQAEENPASKK